MPEHPIENLMKTAMASIKEMISVNTVVGEPVETPDGTVIIPISRVSLGFAAGGSDFAVAHARQENAEAGGFGGGSGAGVTIHPIGFLVVGQGNVRLLPVDGRAIYDRLLDLAPQVVEQIKSMLNKRGQEDTTSAAVPHGNVCNTGTPYTGTPYNGTPFL